MTDPFPCWLGLDVGGANIKAAHSSGEAFAVPFALWKRPEDLPRVIASLAARFPAFDRVALTMTAELCDCYATKAEGVIDVLRAVRSAIGDCPLRIWGTDAAFHSESDILERPELAAASNWLALATLAARLIPEGPGLLIDIGSTTTDLIPLLDGRAVPTGTTDTERLRTGELVYAGVRRTPICALAHELPWRGAMTGLAAELFATTLDIYLVLGHIPPDPLDDATADGRPATLDAARDRLARMIGADRAGFSAQDAIAFAQAADEALMTRLMAAAGRTCGMTRGGVSSPSTLPDPLSPSSDSLPPLSGPLPPCGGGLGWGVPGGAAIREPLAAPDVPPHPTLPHKGGGEDRELLARRSGESQNPDHSPRATVVSGSGEFLARRLAHRLIGDDAPIIGLSEAWGPVASVAGCAHALVILAAERAEEMPYA